MSIDRALQTVKLDKDVRYEPLTTRHKVRYDWIRRQAGSPTALRTVDNEMQMITTICPVCGTSFEQPNDPGRKKIFDRDSCRQRDYRARSGRSGHEAAEAKKAAEQARKDEQARRARERRARERERVTADAPAWLRSAAQSAGKTDKERRAAKRGLLIWARMVHKNTPAPEKQTCRDHLMSSAARYGWPSNW